MEQQGDKGKHEWVIGVRVRLKTALGDEVEGEIYTYDPLTNVVVLHERKPQGKSDVRIIKANFIKEVSVLSQPTEEPNLRLPAVNLNKLKQKEEQLLRKAKEDSERIGIGVSAEAQEIFDQLSKTMPVRWDKETIYVFDDVRIVPPYFLENCTGPPNCTGPTLQSVNHVKKTLKIVWDRLRRTMTSPPPSLSPTSSTGQHHPSRPSPYPVS
mmetsp:Transcript_21135/g.36269  ORF Transcript_21135/g.36269 Transcript_21135/m.36269 type:complete len:211 (+) Transcript_21135:104-736(+)